VISQARLARIIELRREIETVKSYLEQAETEVQAGLEANLPVESGLLKAFLRITERRSVAWKNVVERELGEDYAKRVLAATKPEAYTNLVVTA
jgi:hypothetical protein